MDCISTENKLIFFLENNLPADQVREITNHLASCAGCSAKLEFLKETLSILDKEKSIPVRPFLFTRIQGRLQEKEIPRKFRVLRPLFLAAALVVGLFSGILMAQLTVFSSPANSPQEYEIADLFYEAPMENMENMLLEEDF
ncbi:MAG: hypothetical protein PHT64_07130 [Bacteroidales bacterium]|nr:hypothetical protein [Bacteroidales bacterium]MDD4029871.1 hypothetical protein [Bacteroidales bacterium]MDD4434951.1 hypothetical protein [Bacteroidales bacterium]MDD5733551.1 hypothetical protein [Bacteroidales bacterium]